MSLSDLYVVTLTIGIVSYLALTAFFVVNWIRNVTGRAALSASLLTTAYLLLLASQGLGRSSVTIEASMLFAWVGLLTRVIGLTPANARSEAFRPVTVVFSLVVLIAASTIICAWWVDSLPVIGVFLGLVLVAVGGLVILEQVVRNTLDDLRWRLRYLTLGVGTILGFELIHNATALLFNTYVPQLLAIQPAVFALVAPFIALASLRNSTAPLRFNLSRRFVFGSGVLIGTGLLMLLLGILGYLVRALGGDWQSAILALAGIAAGLLILTVLGSSHVRMLARRWVEENLLASKYDYRHEWRRVTEQLTEPNPDYDLPQQAVRAFSRVLNSTGGAVWRLSEGDILLSLNTWQTPWSMPLSPATSRKLKAIFDQHDVIIDLKDPADPNRAALSGCRDLQELEGIRFVIPLLTQSRLFGIASLNDPSISMTLSAEDHDLLKLIAREAAGLIALREADRELAESDRLKGFSQMSAFLVHDMKTISSQLSLMLDNADRHRSDPRFIEDMLKTTRHAVGKMRRLVEQLREGQVAGPARLSLNAEVGAVLEGFRAQQPLPVLLCPTDELTVNADAARLRAALGHLVQNAIDAVRERVDASVEVLVRRSAPWAEVVIRDNGPGMSQHFIDNLLFAPLASTKGVSGMGIGAYQARTYIRSIGGDVTATSLQTAGAQFIVRIPIEGHHD